MNWIEFDQMRQLEELTKASFQRAQVIFKYSYSCSLSEEIRIKLERSKAPTDIDFHFLDLLRYRSISNAVAEQFNVRHQSPQVLLIINGECRYHESHMRIRMDEIEAQRMFTM